MTFNEKVIRDFIGAWSRLNANELVDYFTPDGIYHNMPMAPVAGREKLAVFIAGFIQNWEKTDWDILNISANGNIVFAERLDRTLVGDITVHLPCCAVFEMEGGKIKVWRDYFDMTTYTKPLESLF